MNSILTGRRILLVEDETLISLMIEDMLVELGCGAVTSAATANAAVGLVSRQAFDAALVDMNLNGTSSRPVVEALAARGIPFAIATGNSVDEMWGDFRDRAVLRKPFGSDDLSDVLARLLRTERQSSIQ
ncbi:response regulator [Filomicrobium sp.]|uniref:response regulator n=1 Tax=Filomicrobium sp. TaxID=2024831 RepID=UPI00258DF4FC|nr:response regulator [Filomicrobium sp.]MCV0371060.1 response regulator [Filomicrobium sp.]